MTHTLAIELRPAAEADSQLLRRVYAETRDELALLDWTTDQKLAFLEMQFCAQDRHYRGQFPNAAFAVIELDGEPAGRLYVDRTADRIHLLDIALLPEHRGRGVGTALLRQLQEEAAAAGIPVVLHVETSNPAASLYNDLGFVATSGGEGLYQEMRWSA
jgi:ribosomal protein S18 acetylase RimI-like enzyme